MTKANSAKAPTLPKRRTMYDRNVVGRTREVLEAEVDTWKAAGWYLTPSDDTPAEETELSVLSDTQKTTASANDAAKPTKG